MTPANTRECHSLKNPKSAWFDSSHWRRPEKTASMLVFELLSFLSGFMQ